MKTVVILIPQSREFERGLLRGIAKYSRMHGPWAIYMKLPDYKVDQPRFLTYVKQLRPDGFIVRIPFSGKLEDIVSFKKPVIVTDTEKPVAGLHSIEPDCELPAQLITEYFCNKGYINFGFAGFTNSYWCLLRGRYLKQALIAKHRSLSQHFCRINGDYLPAEEQNKLIQWLSALPKPAAILTTNCDLARHVLEACKIASILVPEQAAILGFDNDPLTCELSSPSLSSISYNFEHAGYEAARILDRLMAKQRMPIQKIVVRPMEIVIRESTDISLIENFDVANALSFIQQNSKKILQVDDVVAAANTTRRSLERKFHTILNRSIYMEIIQVRMKRAAQMLCETSLPISEIAAEFGYSEYRYFSRCFKSIMKMSPSSYRKRFGKI
jgi:LacI family transcriptional regulator